MSEQEERRLDLTFDDNHLVPVLFGEHNIHLSRLENQTGVSLWSRGNVVTLNGSKSATDLAKAALDGLWGRIKTGQIITIADVDSAVRMAANMLGMDENERTETAPPITQRKIKMPQSHGRRPFLAASRPLSDRTEPEIDTSASDTEIKTKRKHIRPRTPMQLRYLRLMQERDLVFGLGPAGTGKTYLAVAQAVSMLLQGNVDRIVLTRPAVEAGEQLGFLPGDLQEKIDPYLRPIYDALNDMLPPDQVARRIADNTIEIAPLAFMRGRTLSHAFVILDEAQNTTPMQMKMALTRLGEGSKCVVTGDLSQVDLPSHVHSGLREAVDILENEEGVSIVRFGRNDVVRHALVARIISAYERREKQIHEHELKEGLEEQDASIKTRTRRKLAKKHV